MDGFGQHEEDVPDGVDAVPRWRHLARLVFDDAGLQGGTSQKGTGLEGQQLFAIGGRALVPEACSAWLLAQPSQAA